MMAAIPSSSRPPQARKANPVGTVFIVLGTCVFGVIIVGSAMSSLLNARPAANEATTVGDIRAVFAGEMAYRSANGGFYDTLDCLGSPARCIPNYQGPSFIDSALASLSAKSGYERSFHAGPVPRPGQVHGASPSSMQSYAYVAVPLARGHTGRYGFCGDSSGRICFTRDGSAPPVVDGQCSSPCTPY
jgi:hypothetical protein